MEMRAMTDETTTERLAEIEGQARIVTFDEVAAQQLVRGLVLQVAAAIEEEETAEQQQHLETMTDQLAEPVPQAVDTPTTEYTPPEGWRVLRVGERLQSGDMTVREDGSCYSTERVGGWVWSGQRYIRRIEQKQQPQSQPASDADQLAMIGRLKSRINDLETINEAQEKYVRLAGQENTDLQHRLNVVSAEWADQAETIRRLQQQLEAVKAELVQERLQRNHWQNHAQRTENELVNKDYECRQVRIELDALQQAPQAEAVAVVPTSTEDRFEEGWDAGTARAVETIAEWTEPFRTCGSERLAWMVMQNLPHIMRTLTGLTPED